MSGGVSISHRIAQVGFPGGSVSRIRAPQMRFLRWVQVGLKNIAKTDEFLFCFASMFYNAPREGLCRAFALTTWIRRFRNPRAVFLFGGSFFQIYASQKPVLFCETCVLYVFLFN